MTPTGGPRPLRASHRWSALLVAALWAIAPVLAALHANAEVHRFCAEHGALEETSQSGAPERGDAGPAWLASEGQIPHAGCAFARYCRFDQLLIGFVLERAADLQVARPPERPGAISAPAVALLRLAPKTSPPV